MSADNWTTCPACLARAKGRKEAEKQAVVDAYGKVPVEEFDAIRAKAETPIDDHALQTFREDYGFWIEDATVHVSYEGACTVCKSGVKFRDSRPIEMKELPSFGQQIAAKGGQLSSQRKAAIRAGGGTRD